MHNRREFIKSVSLTSAGMMLLPALVRGTPGFADINLTLRYRQVHLDFHTSGLIDNIAQGFDPTEFASILKSAYVDSVTCFARCHHGYLYYDSKKNPERIHPHLKNKSLLKDQITALHKQNIRVPIYTTVQWDYYTARAHPEWLIRDENGAPMGSGNTNVFQPGFYNHLDIATPYIDFLKEHIKDIFESVPVDGLFLDIHHILPNANETAIAGMLKKGIDPTKAENRLRYNQEILRQYKEDLSSFIKGLDKNCGIFYNSGHVGPGIRNTISYNTHLELESLPSGGWGYLHFPLTARYARNQDKEILGMTGKFHTSWGDFHSLKNDAALEFETSMMLALNARCSIGDQLHPNGKLDTATYALIGKAYKKVSEKEPWCNNAKALVDIGVLSTEEFAGIGGGSRTPEAMMGAVRILQEGGHQFNVVDSESDYSGYRVLILPDLITVSPKLKDKLSKFITGGGSIISSYRSGLDEKYTSFQMANMGVELVGDAAYSPDFIAANGPLAKGLPQTELVMYLKGLQVKATNGAQVLLKVNRPYFNREWDHFSSHKHTPSSGNEAYPAAVRLDRSIYFAHPVFSQYAKNAPLWVKKLVLNAIYQLLPEPLIRHTGPSSLVATVNEQKENARVVLHLLHYIPERRGVDFDTIEEILPLNNVVISYKQLKRVNTVQLVPQKKALPFKLINGRIEFTVPEIMGHQMVAVS